MTSSPIKPVRLYKIGGFKQAEQDPFRGQNMYPFQYGFGNPYQLMYYQNQLNQRQNMTPKSRSAESLYTPPSSQSLKRSKTNLYDKKSEIIDEDEETDEYDGQLETIEEENLIIKKKTSRNDPKPVEKEPEKETKKETKKQTVKETPKIEETKNNKKEPKEQKQQQKQVEIPKQVLHEEKKEIIERFEKTEKTNISTPRSKDGKPFSIRGTTKTVIEVTTTEVVDESIFKSKEPVAPKIIKKNKNLTEDKDSKSKKDEKIESISKEVQTENDEAKNLIDTKKNEDEILPVKKNKTPKKKQEEEPNKKITEDEKKKSANEEVVNEAKKMETPKEEVVVNQTKKVEKPKEEVVNKTKKVEKQKEEVVNETKKVEKPKEEDFVKDDDAYEELKKEEVKTPDNGKNISKTKKKKTPIEPEKTEIESKIKNDKTTEEKQKENEKVTEKLKENERDVNNRSRKDPITPSSKNETRPLERRNSLSQIDRNHSKLNYTNEDNEKSMIRKRVSQSLDERKKFEPNINKETKGKTNSDSNQNGNNQFNLPVIRNLDKTQAKRFEDNSDLKFPSLVTEKPAPHRFKLKFKPSESLQSTSYYDNGYKRCPCLMHNKRYYEKFGIPPDQESLIFRPHSIREEKSFRDYWNDQADNSLIFGEKFAKNSHRNKTSLEKYINGHHHHHHHEAMYSNSQSLPRPAWNEAF